MLVWREKIIPTPVMSLQTGGQLAIASQPIIDPGKLKIVAFYCEGPLIEHSPAVLHASDIREFGELGVIVNDSEVIMPLTDLVRLQDVIAQNFELIGKRVIDIHKRKLGKATNYVLDTDTFRIMRFSVKRPLLQSLQQDELIINRKQIRKVTSTEIVVDAATTEDSLAVLQRDHIQNPFRRPAEQPAEHSSGR